MKLKDYLRDQLFLITISLLMAIFVITILNVFHINNFLVFFIPVCFLLTIVIYFIYDYTRRKTIYNQIKENVKSLDKKYLAYELIDEPHFLEGKLIYDVFYDVCKNANEYVKEYRINQEAFKEYLESWCHEIKLPVSTIKMIIENNPSEISNSIDEELSRIDNDVERVLYYARGHNVQKDYLINTISIKECVNDVIKRNKNSIMNRKIKIDVRDLDYKVRSDSKWIAFILQQIISNCIKYTSDNPIISLYTKDNKDYTVLYIEDNGIGIKDSEINRVFDKGFTGTNGRDHDQHATGFGLYLCKQLCLKLQHKIDITSSKEGTIVSITFPKNTYYDFETI